MSFSFDVNLLVYAVDGASPWHTPAKSFLEEKLNGPERCFLCYETLYGFLRLATHPSLFRSPFSPREAILIAERIEENDRVEMIATNAISSRIFKEIVISLNLRGTVLSDAVIASILQANGVKTIYTHDRDFWKFPYLKPIDPFAKRKG